VDAHHDRAAAAGAEIVMPRDMDYGSREMAHAISATSWGFGTYEMASNPGESHLTSDCPIPT
jgi:hypothetical protein